MARKHGGEYRFIARDRAVYFAATVKGNGLGISEQPFTDARPAVIVLLTKHGRGKRAQVIDRRFAKPYDDRPPEVLGMCFVTVTEGGRRARALRVVVPRAEANFPITKHRELARVAERGEADPRLWQFVNRTAAIGPGGTVASPFGNIFMIDSAKNYAFYDDGGELVFMVYKAAEATFTVRGRSPFTPLTAFALSLAIISG
jgi:hypothetical protein